MASFSKHNNRSNSAPSWILGVKLAQRLVRLSHACGRCAGCKRPGLLSQATASASYAFTQVRIDAPYGLSWPGCKAAAGMLGFTIFRLSLWERRPATIFAPSQSLRHRPGGGPPTTAGRRLGCALCSLGMGHASRVLGLISSICACSAKFQSDGPDPAGRCEWSSRLFPGLP